MENAEMRAPDHLSLEERLMTRRALAISLRIASGQPAPMSQDEIISEQERERRLIAEAEREAAKRNQQ